MDGGLSRVWSKDLEWHSTEKDGGQDIAVVFTTGEEGDYLLWGLPGKPADQCALLLNYHRVDSADVKIRTIASWGQGQVHKAFTG